MRFKTQLKSGLALWTAVDGLCLYRMKLQWKSMSEEQQNRFSGFRERMTQVEKDIGRTDRSQPFYSGEDNPNVALLQDILMTYVMYNFDLGYVQGMSDLLSPLLFIMKNEVGVDCWKSCW